jgi:SOS-response transcriptional repressor LexA
MSQSGCSAEGMEPFALRVIGDSMTPEFQDGHIIVVDPGYPLMSGVFAVVENGHEVIFGQYFREGARCWIEYLNPAFAPVELAPEHQVKGVITQRNTRRRKDTKHYDYPLSEE